VLEIDISADELLSRRDYSSAAARLSRTAAAFSNHPALCAFLLNPVISFDQMRLHGVDRLRKRLNKLVLGLKGQCRNRLVGVRHRPFTTALIDVEEDLVYCSLNHLSIPELKDQIVALHNLADARPVVVEFEQAMPEQDERVASAFAVGAAGVVAPPFTVKQPSDLLALKTFGSREALPFVALNGTCPPVVPAAPMVSVVICAYNAERTMRPCLESLRNLDYPNYEIVIVDDGSRDRTADIAKEFPEFRLIRQPNKGLSVARNVGMHAARGEIIAYTDSDCVVDPHWLTLMVGAMVDNGFDACGGPNYAPAEEGRTEACVAVSPGAPCHVLTAEDRAEHLGRLQYGFRKSALVKLDGFDAQFTAAGDDVDICWRALDAGFTVGFCPAAFVWHFRRNTIKAYYGQQRGLTAKPRRCCFSNIPSASICWAR